MCRKNNLTIPDDLSIVSFDNQDIIKHLEVPLTSIAQCPQEIGLKAIRMLFEKINSEDENQELIQQIYYPTKLIVRDSCLKLEENH